MFLVLAKAGWLRLASIEPDIWGGYDGVWNYQLMTLYDRLRDCDSQRNPHGTVDSIGEMVMYIIGTRMASHYEIPALITLVNSTNLERSVRGKDPVAAFRGMRKRTERLD